MDEHPIVDLTVEPPSEVWDETLLVLQYEETGRLMYTFFEWRHKILTHFFLTVGALGLFIRWTWETDSAIWLRVTPFFLGSSVSALMALMDRVHQRILNMCYVNGRHLEELLFPDTEIGIYRRMHQAFAYGKARGLVNYRVLLTITYVTSAICFLAGGIVELAVSLS